VHCSTFCQLFAVNDFPTSELDLHPRQKFKESTLRHAVTGGGLVVAGGIPAVVAPLHCVQLERKKAFPTSEYGLPRICPGGVEDRHHRVLWACVWPGSS
jgi:hypothetical protein